MSESRAPETSANAGSSANTSTTAKDAPLQLGALEEDDEFEEFPVQDWDDAETGLPHLAAPSSNASENQTSGTIDTLWEDNWDDDDVEDDFSKQLREELAKGSSSTDTPMNG